MILDRIPPARCAWRQAPPFQTISSLRPTKESQVRGEEGKAVALNAFFSPRLFCP